MSEHRLLPINDCDVCYFENNRFQSRWCHHPKYYDQDNVPHGKEIDAGQGIPRWCPLQKADDIQVDNVKASSYDA